MPVVVDGRGVTVYISDEDARRQAEELIGRIEQLNSRDTPIGASDQRTIRMLYEQAQDLLRQTGDVKQEKLESFTRVKDSHLERFYRPGAAEEELAKRDQLRREAAAVTRAGALLGAKWADRVLESSANSVVASGNSLVADNGSVSGVSGSVSGVSGSVSGVSGSVSGASEDKVRLKRDQAAGEWVLSGKGPVTRFKNYDLAEAAARRRAGFK